MINVRDKVNMSVKVYIQVIMKTKIKKSIKLR